MKNKKLIKKLVFSNVLLLLCIMFFSFVYVLPNHGVLDVENFSIPLPSDFEKKYSITPQEFNKQSFEMADKLAYASDSTKILGTDTADGSSAATEKKYESPRFSLQYNSDNFKKVRYENVKPGDKLKDSLTLLLLDDVPAIFSLRFRDAFSKYVSDENLSDIDGSELAIKNWIKYPQGERVIFEGKGSEYIPLEVEVPMGVSPGDYSGMFFTVLEKYGDDVKMLVGDKNFNKESVGTGAKVLLGVGLQFILRVDGEMFPNLFFSDFSVLKKNDKGATFLAKYRNDGNISVVPRAKLVISDMWGKRLFNREYPSLLIRPAEDKSLAMNITADDFNPNAYGIFTVNVELFYRYYNFYEKEQSDLVDFLSGSAKLRIYNIPKTLILTIMGLILFVLILFILKLLILYRMKKSSKIYVVSDCDDLKSLSLKFGVEPKKIIKVNDLKPPFFLEKGMEILIPKK